MVCYLDGTVGLPLLTAYALAKRKRRVPKRLFERRADMMERLRVEYRKARDFRDTRVSGSALPDVDDIDLRSF